MESSQLLDLILHGIAAVVPGLFLASAGLVRWGVLLTGLIVGLDPMWVGWPTEWGSNGQSIYFGIYTVFALFALVAPLRAHILSRPVMKIIRSILPAISETEKEALCKIIETSPLADLCVSIPLV